MFVFHPMSKPSRKAFQSFEKFKPEIDQDINARSAFLTFKVPFLKIQCPSRTNAKKP
jgi:hypothetical protein